jgi:hypothetical protein
LLGTFVGTEDRTSDGTLLGAADTKLIGAVGPSDGEESGMICDDGVPFPSNFVGDNVGAGISVSAMPAAGAFDG